MGERFIWDAKKADSNRLKHGVSFEEAASVFDDERALVEIDLEHGEERHVIIGASSQAKVLYVVHIELEEETIRIISARKADRREKARYYED